MNPFKKETNRILILTGAGFTSSKDFFDINTNGITKLIKEDPFNGIKINGKTPGQYFYDELKNHYAYFEKYKNPEELEKKITKYVNFESILHFIEEIYSVIVPFGAYSNNRGLNPNRFGPENKGMKPAFVNLKPELIFELSQAIIKYKDQIENISSKKNKNEINIRVFIRLIYLKFITVIAKEIGDKLKKQKDNKGFNQFMAFLESNFPADKNYWRWYTLNYDNWISQYYKKIKLYDGFLKQNNEFLLPMFDNVLNGHCHFNLHGCINWTINVKKDEIYKKQRNGTFTYNDINKLSDYNMANDPVMITPIISGYNKSTRITYEPFMSFFHSFAYDISNAALMIVIGYGFSDKHINNLINKRTSPILFIDYKSRSSEKIEFIKKVRKRDVRTIKKMPLKKSLINDDNCKYYFFGGIGDSFYKNSKEIIETIKTEHSYLFS